VEYDEENKVVYFVFPSHIFNDKDFIYLELTFDDISWALCDV